MVVAKLPYWRKQRRLDFHVLCLVLFYQIEHPRVHVDFAIF